MIDIQTLSYSYPNSATPVLSKLTLTIEEGEAVCVMGASGSGKSTLAYILAGLIRDYEGSVTMSGSTAPDRKTAEQVGILFQNPDNQMVATVVDKEIAFGLENLAVPTPAIRQQVAEVAGSFGIVPLLKRLTTELSGGEKQRVALASLMVQKPPVLILDEPDSFLDLKGRAMLDEELQRLKNAQPQLTEIRITQYPAVAMKYPRLIVLGEGTVLADRAPEDVFADHTLTARSGLQYGVNEREEQVSNTRLLTNAASDNECYRSLKLNNGSFHFSQSEPILQNLTLSVDRGEIVGLVGATGAGKSSLGLLLCGIYRPTEGSACLVKSDGNAVSVHERSGVVAGLFQQPERQFFLSSCIEEVAFGPKNVGRVLSDEQLRAFFTLAGLDAERFATRDPFTLSMGEKRRLAFAAVLSMSPAFVIFDEPSCGLDPQNVGRFIRLSRHLRQCGVGQIVISHDRYLLKALSDRVLLLTDGSEIRPIGLQELNDSAYPPDSDFLHTAQKKNPNI